MIRGRVGVEPKLLRELRELRELRSSSAIVETDKTSKDDWLGGGDCGKGRAGKGGVLIAPGSHLSLLRFVSRPGYVQSDLLERWKFVFTLRKVTDFHGQVPPFFAPSTCQTNVQSLRRLATSLPANLAKIHPNCLVNPTLEQPAWSSN
jgi:hypothetical protein